MFKKSFFLLSAVMVCAMLVSACAASATPAPQIVVQPQSAPRGDTYSNQAGGATGAVAPMPAPANEKQAPADASGGEGAGNVLATTAERLVIKNANLALVVKDPAAAVNSIAALADGATGFVVNSSLTQISVDAKGNKILSGQISLRVPAEKLNDTLAQIKALAVTVKSENVTGEDVTAQYVDLQSQLTNLEAEAQQLQKIMDSTVKSEDVLAVYKELASVQGQIETIKGQMKYYTESAAMSLVSVSLEQEWVSQPIETGGWEAQGVFKGIQQAWVAAYQVGVTLLMWLGAFCLPVALIVGVPLFIVVRLGFRWYRRGQAKKTAAA